MKKTRKQKIVMYSMVPITMGMLVVSFASADTGTTTSGHKFKNRTEAGLIHKEQIDKVASDALAQALGMTQADLKIAFSSGKTIDSLITEKGLNKVAVINALRSAHETQIQTRIQADIASGKLTQAQADQMKVERVARELKQKEALASALGISLPTLEAEILAGKTMDQLAREHGLTTEMLKSKLDANRQTIMKANLSERVASGKLTQAQADSILSNKGQGGHITGKRMHTSEHSRHQGSGI